MFLDKIPITSEKKFTFNGVFDIRETYKYMKEYLENTEHFDTTEKELIETNQGGTRKIDSHVEADLQYNDYYKIIIKYRLEASGKEKVINHNGKDINVTEGYISLKVNSYVQADWLNKRAKSPFSKFVDQLYSKYIGKEELEDCGMRASILVSKFMGEFKKIVNMYVR